MTYRMENREAAGEEITKNEREFSKEERTYAEKEEKSRQREEKKTCKAREREK
jgi:hypothetical protein